MWSKIIALNHSFKENMSLYFCQFGKKTTCTLYSNGFYTACVIDLDWLNSNGNVKQYKLYTKRKIWKIACIHWGHCPLECLLKGMLHIDVGLKKPKPCNYTPLSFDSAEVEYELLRRQLDNKSCEHISTIPLILHFTLNITSCTVVTLAIRHKRRQKNVHTHTHTRTHARTHAYIYIKFRDLVVSLRYSHLSSCSDVGLPSYRVIYPMQLVNSEAWINWVPLALACSSHVDNF